jgi:hypothetical protein
MMQLSNYRIFLTCLLFVTLIHSAYSAETQKIEYPEGYRYWTHVKTVVINETHPLFKDFGGIHSTYANEKALQALQNNSVYPDGSVFVFDLSIAEPFPGGVSEGKRRRLDVMQKDASVFASTGGWGFGSFIEDSKELVAQNVDEKCYACHAPQKQSDYVYSEFHK